MNILSGILVVLLSSVSCSYGFLVEGWTEEWEYLNATDIEEARPGFRIRVTQKGFDTAARLGLDLAMAYIDQLVIPDTQETVGNAEVTITNVRINRFARPSTEIRVLPGEGVFARVYKLRPKVTADYRAVMDWGFFGVSEKEGYVTVRGRNLRFSIKVTVGRNPEPIGPIMKIDAECKFEGELNILFVGGLQDILNVGSSVFGSNIMSLIATETCNQVKLNIYKNMATDISSLPVNETEGLEFDLNYGLVRFPVYDEDYIELAQRGTVYYLDDRHEPPFQPEVIPEYMNHTDKMIYIYLSDYVLNSALYAGYLSGYMAYNVTPDLLPPEVQAVLRTSCRRSDHCLGSVFPPLARLYPSAIAGASIYATSNPEIHFLGGTTASVTASGEADFFVDDDYERNFLLKIGFSLHAEVTVGVNGSNINFRINRVHPAVDIISSNIGDIGTSEEFQNVIGVASEKFIIPQLTALGAKGFEIPKSDEVEFVDPEIIPLDVDGTLAVATDFDLSLPAELMAKGLDSFRRRKGPCKRNCTTTTPEPEEEEDPWGEDNDEDAWDSWQDEDEEDEWPSRQSWNDEADRTTHAPRRHHKERLRMPTRRRSMATRRRGEDEIDGRSRRSHF